MRSAAAHWATLSSAQARRIRSPRNIAAPRASIRPSSRASKSSSASISRRHERFYLMMKNFLTFDFGKSYFRDVSVLELIKEKLPVSISLGHMDDAADVSDLDPARHSQGGEGRDAVRHLDERRARRRLCDPGLPVRSPIADPVRRLVILSVVPLARALLRQLGSAIAVRQRSPTTSGTLCCR